MDGFKYYEYHGTLTAWFYVSCNPEELERLKEKGLSLVLDDDVKSLPRAWVGLGSVTTFPIKGLKKK